MIFAHIGMQGELLGIWDDQIGVPPPRDMDLTEITPAQRDAWIRDASLRLIDGQQVQHIPPVTAELQIERIRAAVQAHIDATARERLYDNGNSFASYVASTNPQWAAEAQAFVAWRDAVWAQVYGLWASPPEPWPTPEAVIADLPVINWPA